MTLAGEADIFAVFNRDARKEAGLPGPSYTSSEITAMLQAWSKGKAIQGEEVFPLLYDELRKQAHSFLRRERPGHVLQTTALINETYIKLREQRQFEWESRDYFFAICRC